MVVAFTKPLSNINILPRPHFHRTPALTPGINVQISAPAHTVNVPRCSINEWNDHLPSSCSNCNDHTTRTTKKFHRAPLVKILRIQPCVMTRLKSCKIFFYQNFAENVNISFKYDTFFEALNFIVYQNNTFITSIIIYTVIFILRL